MESPHTVFHEAVNGHLCGHCVQFGECEELDLPTIQRGAEARCLVHGLLLACINWAVPRLCEYGDLGNFLITRAGTMMFALQSEQPIKLSIFQLDAPSMRADSLSAEGKVNLLSGATSSDSTFATIQGWLHDCDTVHSDCARPTLEQPKEVVDMIRFLEIRDDVLILVEHAQGSRPHLPKYACLSHCWGSGAEIVKTLRSNLQSHLTTGIKIALLPRTFKDAVEICQRLHISYLWIDSLCIVQDSIEDWRVQAASMARIYENAYFTIAASAAKNPTEGCFRTTRWSYIGQSLPGYESIYIGQEPLHPRVSIMTDWPLLGRGWIFQELSLSPRVLHFGTDQVMWQCRSKRALETRPNAAWLDEDHGVFLPALPRTTDEVSPQHWYKIVQAYSWRTLTFSKDRLPAIAAMATRMQRRRPHDRYIVGLWQSSLCYDLMWWTNRFQSLTSRPSRLDGIIMQRVRRFAEPVAHRLPSWSWASTRSNVCWSSSATIEKLRCVEVLDIVYTIDGPDVLGEIQNAAITLRTPLFKFDLSKENEARFYPVVQNPQLDGMGSLQGAQSVGASKLYCIKTTWDDYGEVMYYSRADKGITREMYVVFLVVDTALQLWCHKALIVAQTERPNEYCRLGTVEFDLLRQRKDVDAWRSTHDGQDWNYPHERVKAFWDELISILAAETRVITLV